MSRLGSVSRRTAETRLEVHLDLDGEGRVDVSTGVGFFDHLLRSLAHHALFDLRVRAEGDLEVDDHHTVEDTMLTLGKALAEALGAREGIARFGDAAVPMDEALARAAVDAGGRPYAAVDLPFRAERLGALSTQMIPHALEALAQAGGLTLHLSGSGRNDHHLAEAAFKALARALRAAVAPDPRREGVASTKAAVEEATRMPGSPAEVGTPPPNPLPARGEGEPGASGEGERGRR